MARRTKKVGITGKYGTRYGASLRKQIQKIETQQHSKFVSPFSGKKSAKRLAVGIWHCKSSNKKIAGGAWALSTAAATTIKTTVARLRKQYEEKRA